MLGRELNNFGHILGKKWDPMSDAVLQDGGVKKNIDEGALRLWSDKLVFRRYAVKRRDAAQRAGPSGAAHAAPARRKTTAYKRE